MTTIWNILAWLIGGLFTLIGFVNMFWGNDPMFGVFLVALSIIFYPPVKTYIKSKTGYYLSWIVKLIVGLFILWSSLGVGELFDKIDLMLKSFS